LRDPDLRLGASPDFFIHGDPRGVGVLQTKTVDPAIFARDWDEGRAPPEWIQIQVTVERMLSGAAFAAVAAMVMTRDLDLEIIEVPFDRTREEQIVEAVKLFWTRVDEGIEPEPDFAKDSSVIRALTLKAMAGKTIDLHGNNELPEMLNQRMLLKERMKHDETRCTEIENEIRFLMGDAEIAEGLDGWRITYKVQHNRGYLVKPYDARKLLIYDKRAKL
jgi:predicted phage-related endonuclease